MLRKKASPVLDRCPSKVIGASTRAANETAEARIEGLERQITELYAFFDAKGLTKDLPESIQKHRQTREENAESFARSIRVDSDDMSEAMLSFIDDIKRLPKLRNPTALGLAYDCVLYLGRRSYADLEMCGTAGSAYRPSDEPADELLVSIVRERREHAEVWDWRQNLAELEDRFKELYDYGVESWFPESIELLQR